MLIPKFVGGTDSELPVDRRECKADKVSVLPEESVVEMLELSGRLAGWLRSQWGLWV